MKKVTYSETVAESERKWRGATFFTATDTDESTADKKIDKLVKKYLKNKGKNHTKKVEDV